MTGSAPSDLAVAFRSFARRHREATDAAAEAGRGAEAAPHLAAVAATVASAAAALSADVAGDLPTATAAVADAIEAIDADEWNDDLIERLRSLATEAGQHLRRAEDAAAD